MNEAIDAKNQGITVDLRRKLWKKADFQFVQHIPGNTVEKGILAISHIRDAVQERFMVLFSEFLLIPFVWEESFPWDNLTDEVPVVAPPFATGEFDSTVFVNTVIYSGGGYYRLANVNFGLCLTVKGNSKAGGANIIRSKWAA